MRTLLWNEYLDDNGNSTWEANSHYGEDGCPFMWRLRTRLINNKIEYYEEHDGELMSEVPRVWNNLEEAKEEIQKDTLDIIENEEQN